MNLSLNSILYPVLLLSVPLTLPAEVRKWTSKAGTSLEAEMTGVDIAARTITLKKADGSPLTIPIDALSDADKAFAAAEWKKMQATPAMATAPTPAPKAATPNTPAAAAPSAPAAAGRPAPPRPALTLLPAKTFKAPNSADYLAKVLKTRPRLIHAEPGWAKLKNYMAADPVFAKMVANLKSAGEKLLETPELTRVFGEQRGAVTPGSKAIYRIATLGALKFLDGDPRWEERAVREMIAITDPATFQNWYVDEPEVTADFLVAASLGYDYFRNAFTAKQLADVKLYMVQKGIDALAARLKGDPIPATARGQAAGVDSAPKPKAAPAKSNSKKQDEDEADAEHMIMASALIMSAICMVDDDPSAARQAIDAAGKVFGKGMTHFAPAGIWPEGMEAGEKVLDYAIMVMQTLKSNMGGDFGFSMLEGVPQSGLARLHLVGPTGSLFNYGDSAASTLSRPWVSTWLAGQHGNFGQKALTAGSAPGAESAFLNLAGHVMYYNEHAAGEAKPDALDYGFVGGQLAALRSAWDRNALYVAVKGGDNSIPTAQLDLGSFILEAAGKRWAIELGVESDRAPGFDPKAADRSKRYQLYVEGTPGQNTLEIGQEEDPPEAKKGAPPPKPVISTNQSWDGKAQALFVKSSPEAAMAAFDLKEAYSKATKEAVRGVMLVRGPKPYVVLQDDLVIKNNTPVTWKMHTRAEISVDGKSATLTDKEQKLHAVILSPANATFSTAEPPEPSNEQMKKLTGIHVLKVNLAEGKGPQTISIAFAPGEPPPAHPVKPIAEWVGKK